MKVVAGVPALFAGLLVSWLLARPDGPDPVAVPATLALGVSVVILGLGFLSTVDARPSSRLIGALAGVWVVATLISAWVRTADRAGIDVLDVTAGGFGEVLGSGTSEMVALVVGLLIVVWAVLDLLTDIDVPVLVVGALAGIGVLATAIAGHAGNTAIGPILVGAHALAAAWWVGVLAAIAISVRGRSGWARSLPAFSGYATWAVGIIAVTGVVAAITQLDAPADLFTTGYGRVLVAKVVMLAALVGVAVRHRRRWLPAVERHRTTEVVSIRNAVIEVALMAVVLGLAAGLSATAP
ncbi:copper resistance D family protein [Gordonia aurantiaca]|uniref:copper resistance D family protein n=1 Tax=Gordonia sp. B21 TaxID=3151852 RepID=UPI003264DBAD